MQLARVIDQFAVGDRVAYPMTLGAYAETRLIGADKLVRIPDTISDETAAAMMLKGFHRALPAVQNLPGPGR